MAIAGGIESLGLTGTEQGIYTVLIFMIAYGFVMAEEFTHLRKSKPVILAAGIIWAHAAILASKGGVPAIKPAPRVAAGFLLPRGFPQAGLQPISPAILPFCPDK